MGLLDMMGSGWDDPKTAATLNLAAGLLSTRGIGGLVNGMQGYAGTLAQAKKQAQEEAERKQMAEMRAMQLQQMQQAMADEQERRAALGRMAGMIAPPTGGIVPGAAPTTPAQIEAAAGTPGYGEGSSSPKMGPADPNQQFMYEAMKSRLISPMDYLNSTRKDTAPVKVGAGETMVAPDGKGGFRVVFSNPKEADLPADVRGYQFAVSQGYKGTFDQWDQTRRRASANSVNVVTDSLGLKPKDRFEMEGKLASDYGNATKLDNVIVSNAQDIKNILSQGGALKDQAAIYKFAKTLDPDGAVREADYDAIVKTAGGVDYVKSLLNRALTGEQLSQRQRSEMSNLMNAMASVAQKRIAAQQAKTARTAKLYNLDPQNIFSQPADDGWGIEGR